MVLQIMPTYIKHTLRETLNIYSFYLFDIMVLGLNLWLVAVVTHAYLKGSLTS
jgi:hypothetical protein